MRSNRRRTDEGRIGKGWRDGEVGEEEAKDREEGSEGKQTERPRQRDLPNREVNIGLQQTTGTTTTVLLATAAEYCNVFIILYLSGYTPNDIESVCVRTQ